MENLDSRRKVAALELRGLTKIYGAEPAHGLELLRCSTREQMAERDYLVAVDNIDLTIAPGEIFVVMGLSGSGKSTLLRCINRLIEPTAGSVLIEGRDVVGLSHAELLRLRVEKLGMVFQHFALFPHLSVIDNVAFGLRVKGVSKRVRREKASAALGLVGLAGWEAKKPHQLSGGMQQRVGLARALCLQPPILLMDEPFGSLDPLIREEMQRELLRLQQSLHKTVLFVTHDLNEAIQLGSRIAIFREGRIVQMGTPLEIIAKPHDDYVSAFVRDVNVLKILTLSHAIDEKIAVAASGNVPPGQDAVIIDGDRRPVAIVESGRRTKNSDFLRIPANGSLDEYLARIVASPNFAVVVDNDGRHVGALTSHSIIKAISSRRTLNKSFADRRVDGRNRPTTPTPVSPAGLFAARIGEKAAAANLKLSNEDVLRLALSAETVVGAAQKAASALGGDRLNKSPAYSSQEHD